MGVWEDALREAAAQRLDEVQSLSRQRAEAAEQVRTLSDFIGGMQRLGIRPQRHPFLVLKGSPDAQRYRASHRHKIVGWDIGASAVVTPDGSVYDLKNQDKEPCDLRRPHMFGPTGDRSRSLTDLLGEALRRAMQNR
jgi:hypothetical protein